MPLRYLLVAPVTVLLLVSAAAFNSNTSDTDIPQIQLNDSAAAMQLEEHLPRSLLFNDSLGTAQVAYLAEPPTISTVDPVSDYRAGDVAYSAAEQSIVVFLTDGGGVPTDDLVLVAHVRDGLDDLAGCNRNCRVSVDSLGERPFGVEQTECSWPP